MLRAAREALDISSREMADRLNWMPTHLHAVEENRFEALRGAAFARGYLRAYSKQVELPESVVLAAFDAMRAPELPASDDRVEGDVESPLKKPEVGIALGLVCAAILIAGLWWWQSAAPQQPVPAVTSVAEEPTGEAEPEQPASDQLLVVAAEQFAATQALLEESALEEAEAEVVEAEELAAQELVAEEIVAEEIEAETPLDPVLDQQPGSPAEDADTDMTGVEGEAMLQFRFTGDCWVEVLDGNDEMIHRDLRRAGDSLNLEGSPPFNILVGDALAVELLYQGEPVVIRPRRGLASARFTVGAP